MNDWNILSIVTFLPIVGALLIAPITVDSDIAKRNIRNVALITTITTFVFSLLIWINFDNSQAGFQFC